MAKFLKKHSGTIEATQWCKNGDHPEDDVKGIEPEREGKVVGYYRNPHVKGSSVCSKCGYEMHDHGWIGFPKFKVCPGDWIITDEFGNYSPCERRLFEELYEPMEESKSVEKESKKAGRWVHHSTLDVKRTHEKNPDCPMRLARSPAGAWYCVDCGLHILHKPMRFYGEEK